MFQSVVRIGGTRNFLLPFLMEIAMISVGGAVSLSLGNTEHLFRLLMRSVVMCGLGILGLCGIRSAKIVFASIELATSIAGVTVAVLFYTKVLGAGLSSFESVVIMFLTAYTGVAAFLAWPTKPKGAIN